MPANRPLWGLLPRRKVHAATATELYGRLVALSREPSFYADLGAPDTPEGRLEILMLHVVLMLRRISREGDASALAQALSETFVTDIDDCLREMGVGDMAVARKVKKAAAALFDRLRSYGAALGAGDAATLSDAIARHLADAAARPTDPAVHAAGAARIAAHAMALDAALQQAGLDDVVSGAAALPPLAS